MVEKSESLMMMRLSLRFLNQMILNMSRKHRGCDE
jgi:hypothetical protein